MPRLYVLFDTNLYRTLSNEAFESIIRLERNASIVGYASYWAGLELLSHLASPTDPAFASSWSALRRLERHCTQFDGQRSLIRWIADHEDQACRALFGHGLPHHARKAEVYGRLVGEIAQLRTVDELSDYRKELQRVAEYVKEAEWGFANEIWENVVLRFAPGASSWQALHKDPVLRRRAIDTLERPEALRLAAGMVVDLSAALLQIAITEAQRKEGIDRALELFGTPLRFWISIVRRVIVDGYDLSKAGNANSLWDYHLLFSTSPLARLEGMPFWLITSDKAMLAAANAAGAERVIMSLDNYRVALESDDW